MSHTYSQIYYHLVWSTHEREPIINNSFRQDLYKYIRGGVKNEGGLLCDIGGVADHVHLLVTLPPRLAVSDLVRNIKINSSKWFSKNVFERRYPCWQTGYGVFSVSTSNVEEVVRYIQNQEQHHLTRSFQDEFLTLLRKHKIKFNEQKIWE